jgi:hypothetical protein
MAAQALTALQPSRSTSGAAPSVARVTPGRPDCH